MRSATAIKEDEADGDAVGQDHQHDAEQECINGLEYRHCHLTLGCAAARHQRVPRFMQIEAALQEHEQRADDRTYRADQHDGSQAQEEGQQSVRGHYTITLPSSVMAFSRSSSVRSSPISM